MCRATVRRRRGRRKRARERDGHRWVDRKQI